MSRRRPLSSTRAGGAEVRSRCAHHASARAGPFDAVIDFVRSQRLESSACLLLPPALGLSRALFRCLRCLPSLLRHAALLAMSEWRCRTVPAGIANTALPITTAEQKHQHFRWIERRRTRIHTTSCVSTTMTDARGAARIAVAQRRAQFFGVAENIDNTRVFVTFGFSSRPRRGAYARRNSSDKNCRHNVLSMSDNL